MLRGRARSDHRPRRYAGRRHGERLGRDFPASAVRCARSARPHPPRPPARHPPGDARRPRAAQRRRQPAHRPGPGAGRRRSPAPCSRCRPPRARVWTSRWRPSAPRRRRSSPRRAAARVQPSPTASIPRTPLTGTGANDDSAAERRLRLGEALAEVIGHFGRRPAGDMPGLLPGIGVRALARARGPQTVVPRQLGSAPRRRRCPCRKRGILLRPLLRGGGAPAAPPPLRRRPVRQPRPRGLHQRRRGHRAAVRSPRRSRAPDRAVPPRPLRAARPASLVPRDGGRALRPRPSRPRPRPAARRRRRPASRSAASSGSPATTPRRGSPPNTSPPSSPRPTSAGPAAPTASPRSMRTSASLVVPLEAAMAALAAGEMRNAPADAVALLARPQRGAAPRRLDVSARLDGARRSR